MARPEGRAATPGRGPAAARASEHREVSSATHLWLRRKQRRDRYRTSFPSTTKPHGGMQVPTLIGQDTPPHQIGVGWGAGTSSTSWEAAGTIVSASVAATHAAMTMADLIR